MAEEQGYKDMDLKLEALNTKLAHHLSGAKLAKTRYSAMLQAPPS